MCVGSVRGEPPPHLPRPLLPTYGTVDGGIEYIGEAGNLEMVVILVVIMSGTVVTARREWWLQVVVIVRDRGISGGDDVLVVVKDTVKVMVVVAW